MTQLFFDHNFQLNGNQTGNLVTRFVGLFPSLRRRVKHLLISFLILSPVMFFTWIFFDFMCGVVMSEFAPIFLSLVISLLVSLMLFGLLFLGKILSRFLYFRPFPLNCIPFMMVFFFLLLFFFFFIDEKETLPKNILVLGGSAILFYVFRATDKEFERNAQEILLYIFFASSVLASFFSEYNYFGSLVFTLIYFIRFFFPLNLVAALLLVARASLFFEWSFPLFIQVFLIYGYIHILRARKGFLLSAIAIYILSLILILITPGVDWDGISKNGYCPISGMLTLYITYLSIVKKNEKKDFFLTLFLFLINGIFIHFMGGGINHAFAFGQTFLFLFIFIFGLVISKARLKNQQISLLRLILDFQLLFFFSLFLGFMGILISDSYKGKWPDFHQYSIVQQIVYFGIFFWCFKKEKTQVKNQEVPRRVEPTGEKKEKEAPDKE